MRLSERITAAIACVRAGQTDSKNWGDWLAQAVEGLEICLAEAKEIEETFDRAWQVIQGAYDYETPPAGEE